MPQTRDSVFRRVEVDHLIEGGTRISWSLRRHFKEVGPYVYQLQAGATGVSTADDWVDVGEAGTGIFSLADFTQRVFGKRLTTHYRIKLTTSDAIHYSAPASTYGLLGKRDWLLARAIVRKELLRHNKKSSPNGFLLKRKWTGTVVPDDAVIDPLTGEIIKSSNTDGKGTEFVGGYFAPVPMFIDVSPETNYVQLDPNRGTINDIEIQGRAIAYPQLNHKDIWVNSTSDERYVIHRVQNVAEIRSVPIIVTVTMRPVSFKDPAYDVELPVQANQPQASGLTGVASSESVQSATVTVGDPP
jgi:hypothetical protein